MQNEWVLNGKVVSGVRKAAYFTQLDWVQVQCREKLGFNPYPGTLNLEISEEDLPIIEALQEEEGIALIPPDPNFCAAKALPLSIGDVSGAIIIPAEDVSVHGKNVIEVISPLRLKDALHVDDGDSLTLTVKKSGS
jgi:CTP-dependent riboflavin kinase